MLNQINLGLSSKFRVPLSEIGPWAWQDPFCQDDPAGELAADELLKDRDVIEISRQYFNKTGFGREVDDILARSDLYERENKNQHAFCDTIGRDGDVRIFLNAKNNFDWLETTMHELGHAVDHKSISMELPWLFRTRSHILTTEAVAIFFGGQSQNPAFLRRTIGSGENKEKIYQSISEGFCRQKLIFSRWTMLMTQFESELYSNPEQDLNRLWWSLVEKIQGIKAPRRPANAADWATKMHIALTPVYYHNYQLGYMASEQLAIVVKENLAEGKEDPGLAEFLKNKWFSHGASFKWDALIKYATGKELSPDAWLKSVGVNI